MTLANTGVFVQRWWWLLVLGLSIAAASTLVVSERTPKVYEARARAMVTPDAGDPGSTLTTDQLIATYATLMQARPILDAAAAETPAFTSDAIAASLNLTPVPGTQLIDIKVRASDPNTAASIANLVATTSVDELQARRAARFAARGRQLITLIGQLASLLSERTRQVADLGDAPAGTVDDQQLARAQAALTQAQQDYINALTNLDSVRLAEANAGPLLSLIDPAAAPSDATLPRTAINVYTAALVGLLLAIGAALLLDLLADPLPAPRELGRLTGLRVIGTVEELEPAARAQVNGVGSFALEPFRRLRSVLRGKLPGDQGEIILVTSDRQREGKTTIACGLAAAFALANERVLLVDANPRHPDVAARFGVAPVPGLGMLLADDRVPSTSVVVQSQIDHLDLLPFGPATANGDLLASRRMAGRMLELRQLADVVILDGGALGATEDVRLLGAWVDRVVWVIDGPRTTARAVRQAAAHLREFGTTPISIVVNRTSSTFSEPIGNQPWFANPPQQLLMHAD